MGYFYNEMLDLIREVFDIFDLALAFTLLLTEWIMTGFKSSTQSKDTCIHSLFKVNNLVKIQMFNTVILLACTDRATLSTIVYFTYQAPASPFEKLCTQLLESILLVFFI